MPRNAQSRVEFTTCVRCSIPVPIYSRPSMQKHKKTRISQNADCLQTIWGPFSIKFKATAIELDQERTQLRCYKDILLNGDYHKSN